MIVFEKYNCNVIKNIIIVGVGVVDWILEMILFSWLEFVVLVLVLVFMLGLIVMFFVLIYKGNFVNI